MCLFLLGGGWKAMCFFFGGGVVSLIYGSSIPERVFDFVLARKRPPKLIYGTSLPS